MQRIETAVLAATLGAVPIIACFLAGWWASIPFVPEASVWRCAVAGLLFGILVDVLLLRRWVRRAYSMKTWIWMGVYAFYSMGMLGFFMGVPIFNLVLALPAGVFVGRYLAQSGADSVRMQRTARQTATFTLCILGLVCLASASVALGSPSTASELQGMLRLPFPVTRLMIICLISGGGALLLALDWWITIRCVTRAYEYFVILHTAARA